MKKPLIGYKSSHGEIVYVGGIPMFETRLLLYDKVNHLVNLDESYCTCDPMPNGYYNAYVPCSCPHRQELLAHFREYNDLPDEITEQGQESILQKHEEDDGWLDFIKEQDDRKNSWMM